MPKTVLTRVFLIIAVAAFAFAAFPQPASAQLAGNMSPIRIEFDKQGGVDGIWHGTVSGDVSGGLTTEWDLPATRPTGQVLHVKFDWIIDAGAQSFTAELEGTLNLETGAVVMNGKIVEGWLTGAQVHEEGQLIDPDMGRFQGRILIFPATAD